MRIGRRWKDLFCAAGMAAIIFAGCRRSESESARRATAAPGAQRPPFGYIDNPKENETVASGSRGYGWALDDSGVANIAVSLDNGPATPAELGQNYPGVRDAYPTFPNSDKAGFSFVMPSVASGPHLLVVTITGKDGGKTDLKRHILIK